MSDTTLPKITAPELEDAKAKIYPYLEAALEYGIAPRPITGLMLRLGDTFGVDINAVGEVTFGGDEDEAINDAFFDNLMMAVWILCEKDETLIDVEAEGGKAPAKAYLRWKLKHLGIHSAEAAAMRAFLARWIEHRLEMAAVYGSDDATPADA